MNSPALRTIFARWSSAAIALFALPLTAAAQVEVPEAMRVEHTALHEALAEATRVPGRVGEAAMAVARVLDPHFVREEQIALPPLGLLAQLADGGVTPDMEAVLPLTDSLKLELPQMLEEHRAIHAALENLAKVAREEGQQEYARLAEEIMLHARTEEQVTYPAALLVGEYVRLRLREPGRRSGLTPPGTRPPA